MLYQLAGRWPGAIVAAIAIDDPLVRLPDDIAPDGRVRLVPVLHPPSKPFPINALRNAALAHVSTSHTLLIDVDLWPSSNLVEELDRLDASWWTTDKLALVLPAFQLLPAAAAGPDGEDPLHPISPAAVPATLAALQRCLGALECTVFKGQVMGAARLHAVPGQHLSVDYARWWALAHDIARRDGHLRAGGATLARDRMPRTTTTPYRIPCFDKTSFEPYLIVPTPSPITLSATATMGQASPLSSAMAAAASSTPLFDERFNGYGKNKVQWVQALRALGATFWVLPNAFLAHFPHEVTKDGRQWQRNRGGHKQRMDALFEAQLTSSERRRSLEPAARRCAATATACRVPLMQFIDPLDASYAGRRVATSQVLA